MYVNITNNPNSILLFPDSVLLATFGKDWKAHLHPRTECKYSDTQLIDEREVLFDEKSIITCRKKGDCTCGQPSVKFIDIGLMEEGIEFFIDDKPFKRDVDLSDREKSRGKHEDDTNKEVAVYGAKGIYYFFDEEGEVKNKLQECELLPYINSVYTTKESELPWFTKELLRNISVKSEHKCDNLTAVDLLSKVEERLILPETALTIGLSMLSVAGEKRKQNSIPIVYDDEGQFVYLEEKTPEELAGYIVSRNLYGEKYHRVFEELLLPVKSQDGARKGIDYVIANVIGIPLSGQEDYEKIINLYNE